MAENPPVDSEIAQELQGLRSTTIPISDVSDSPWRIDRRAQLEDFENNHRVVGSSSYVDGLRMNMAWTEEVTAREVASWWNELEQKGYVADFHHEHNLWGCQEERMELVYPPKQIISSLPRENWLHNAELTITEKRKEGRRRRKRRWFCLFLVVIVAGFIGALLADYWRYI